MKEQTVVGSNNPAASASNQAEEQDEILQQDDKGSGAAQVRGIGQVSHNPNKKNFFFIYGSMTG